MKTVFTGVLVVLLAGCGAEVLTTTAIRGELEVQQIKAIEGQLNSAASVTGRINIERAIQTYLAEKGEFPPSLEALVPDWLPQLPMQSDGTPYGYDPGSGRLVEAAVAAQLPTPEDYALMEEINAAIHQYGTATGYYPANLDTLAPQYLAEAPRTSLGEEFTYNNQNGSLEHPRKNMRISAQPQRGGGMAVGGGGPMGEAMTSIGVMNELNSMNQSGTSSAGSNMRGSARDVSNNQQDRTNQAMDDLGL